MKHIIVGEPVDLDPVPTNTYQVSINQMSGDADAYNVEIFNFTSQNETIEFVELVEAIKNAQETGYCRDRKELEEALTAAGFKDVNTDDFYDICGSDVTAEGYLASVESYELFYFDHDGWKFYASIEND